MKATIALSLALAVVPAMTDAQSPGVTAAIQSGQVGERYDGYMGFAAPASDQLRRQVLSINIQRRNLYTELATQRNVTVQLVGLTAACTLFAQISPGEAYMLKDGLWRRLPLGQAAPRPDQCR